MIPGSQPMMNYSQMTTSSLQQLDEPGDYYTCICVVVARSLKLPLHKQLQCALDYPTPLGPRLVRIFKKSETNR